MLRPHINLTPHTRPAPTAPAIGTTALARNALPPSEAVIKLLRSARLAQPEQPRVQVTAHAVKPERCCVYCGHGLYVPPKSTVVRCPVCTRELSVLDITLTGDVQKADEIVTAGKITVPVGARVAADLVACFVEIGGKVLGDVLASQTCRIRCTGKMSGHILCRNITIEPGAEMTGSIETITDGEGPHAG